MPDETPIDPALSPAPEPPAPAPKPKAAPKAKASPKAKAPAVLALNEIVTPADVQTAGQDAPVPRRWRVDLPNCCDRIVEAVDEAGAFDAFCTELGITGSAYTPVITPLN